MAEKCIVVKADGTQCRMWRQRGSEYCVYHDPEISPEEHRSHQVRGGELSHRAPEWISTAKNNGLSFADLAEIGFEILENERAMGRSPAVAAVMNSTLRLLIDLAELSTLGARLEVVEELLQNFNRGSHG